MATASPKKGEDHWDAAQYQNAAGFVPKLAAKVMGWLDVKSGDVILDVGCGGRFSISPPASFLTSPYLYGQELLDSWTSRVDFSRFCDDEGCLRSSAGNLDWQICIDGILNLQIAQTLSQGTGKIHGIDSSTAMISAAKQDAEKAGVEKICTFEGISLLTSITAL
jgi:hypothetical protein